MFLLKSIPKLFFHCLFPILYWITFGQQDLSLFPAEITQPVVQITSVLNVLEFFHSKGAQVSQHQHALATLS